MPTLFYVHWNQHELDDRAALLRDAGYSVVSHATPGIAPPVPRDPAPDAVILSLDRLPSHARAIADWLVETRSSQHLSNDLAMR